MGLIIKIAIERETAFHLHSKGQQRTKEAKTYYLLLDEHKLVHKGTIQNIELEKETKKKRTDNCPL